MATVRPSEPFFLPMPQAAALAEQAAQDLETLLGSVPETESLSFTESHGVTVTIPRAALRLMLEALRTMKDGHPVTVLPLDAELSTQEAAELLNVSRPYVVKLLDEGKIPSRKVGVYRRVLATDVLAYKQENKAARYAALAELTREAQKLGLGY